LLLSINLSFPGILFADYECIIYPQQIKIVWIGFKCAVFGELTDPDLSMEIKKEIIEMYTN